MSGISQAAGVDPVVQTFRTEIASLDARLLAAINERIAAVAQLHRYKAAHGIPLRDEAREQAMLEHLSQLNSGPLSAAGLAELHAFVLDLVRRESAGA